MPASTYQIRLCQNPACGLRYPLPQNHPFGERCPICLGETRNILERALAEPENTPSAEPVEQPRVCALLDNVRSAWNVGAIFRTSDGLGVQSLHLCGITPTPENPSVCKTALGAEKYIAWDYHRNALTRARALKAAGWSLVALEQDDRSTREWPAAIAALSGPPALIVGNEVSGVDPGLLDLCDLILEIPMLGRKRSLNVEVAFGIAASQMIQALPSKKAQGI